jgi:hypothetical protein
MFRVIKSVTRSYGYTHQWSGPGPCPTYIIGPHNTCHWYRYKRDAVKRAEEFNKCERERTQ